MPKRPLQQNGQQRITRFKSKGFGKNQRSRELAATIRLSVRPCKRQSHVRLGRCNYRPFAAFAWPFAAFRFGVSSIRSRRFIYPFPAFHLSVSGVSSIRSRRFIYPFPPFHLLVEPELPNSTRL
jgi:hypothetical protein